ncbi:MAG TPA: ABC transporter permease [Candidatus Polarisedimenticolaceae bacterium]|nr:ABC transporter permease [Candidatus Polarisedimenticolaceae bacterium]
MRIDPMIQLTLGKVRELLREPEALFWVFIFPILLAVALGIAFRSRGPETLAVGVQQGEGAEWIEQALDAAGGLRAELLDPEEARQKLRTGKVALVVIPGENWTYWSDPLRPESRAAQLAVDDALQRAAGRADAHTTATREMNERGSRYIDFLVPGMLGMNLMGTGMWGIGFYIVNARSKRLLKRLVATPMRKSEYLVAQMLGRLVFLALEVGMILLFARLVFGVPLRGSLISLTFVSILGALTFAGLGLLCGSRARTIEGVSGLMNLTMLPMWIFSGIFFSTSRFPAAMQPVVQALPLTAINDALRAVMLDGASLVSQWSELAIAAGWAVASFAVALWLFRWS